MEFKIKSEKDIVNRNLFKNIITPFLICLNINDVFFEEKIKIVVVNEKNKYTKVVFKDGDVQIVKCAPEDDFDKYVGFSIAIARHIMGGRNKLRSFVDKKAIVAKKEK